MWLVAGIALALVLQGCASKWETTLIGPDGASRVVNREALKALMVNEQAESVPVDAVLYAAGYELVSSITVTDADGAATPYDWSEAADAAVWQLDGGLGLGDRRAVAIAVATLVPPGPVTARPIDVAVTATRALGLRIPAEATGQRLYDGLADHVLIVVLDSFGYVRYTEALEAGLIPTLAKLGPPRLGLTVYPPATSVASAALLTGAPPSVNIVTDRGIRSTAVETMFEVVAQAGLRGVAVEGDALAFNMRDAEIMLSGDRDGNGSTDDNVLANALAVLDAGMPDLLWIHFHGIDDAGHTYGPGAPEEEAAIGTVDAAVGEILGALSERALADERTLVLIVADHGMHLVNEEARLGNHGHLIARDMLIPVFVLEP